MNLNAYLSVEALRIQGNLSPLGHELIKIFDEVFAYKKTLTGSNNLKKISDIRKEAKRILSEKLPKSVFKYTGIKLRLKLLTGVPSHCYAISFEPNEAMCAYEGWFDHSRSREDQTNANLKFINDIHVGINENTGWIDPEVIKKLMGEQTLYFDIDDAFCSDLYHEQATNMTSDEIASIILHECGHILSVIYYFGFFQTSLKNTLNKPLAVKVNDKNFSEALKEVRTLLKNNPSESADFYLNTLKTLEDFKNSDPKFKWYTLPFYMVVNLIFSFIVFELFVFSFATSSVLGIAEALADSNKWRNEKKRKTSDIVNTSDRLTDIEHRADEYVAIHGLSGSLASALYKLTTNSALIDGIMSPPLHKMQTMWFHNLNTCISIAAAPFGALKSGYGTSEERFHKNRRNAIRTLLAPDIPKEMKEGILKQIKLATVVEKANSRRNLRLNAFIELSNSILSAKNITALLIDGNRMKRYEALYERALDLSASDLVYWANKIESTNT